MNNGKFGVSDLMRCQHGGGVPVCDRVRDVPDDESIDNEENYDGDKLFYELDDEMRENYQLSALKFRRMTII